LVKKEVLIMTSLAGNRKRVQNLFLGERIPNKIVVNLVKVLRADEKVERLSGGSYSNYGQ
jgi:hypothetical protein